MTPLQARKKREIDELRLSAGQLFANAALRYLEEAERQLMKAEDVAEVEDLIDRARIAIDAAVNNRR
jgi:hypothetical protein